MPNKTNYSLEFRLKQGLKQNIPFGAISFDMNYLAAYETSKQLNDYYPLIISLNYNDKGKQFALMTYGVFTKNSKNEINGVHVDKQVVLVSVLNHF